MHARGRVFSADSIEILPAAVGILALCGEDTDRSLVEAASFGRDCDTVASVVGSIAGALHGADSLRDEWVEECEAANAEFFDDVHGGDHVDFERVSKWLVEALETERQSARERAETLDSLL